MVLDITKKDTSQSENDLNKISRLSKHVGDNNQKYQESCLTREINFIFNVKPLNNLYLSYLCLK